MADETKGEQNAGAAPVFDAGAFATDMESRMEALLEKHKEKPAQDAIQYPYGRVEPVQHQPQATDDPMANLINPYVQKATKPLADEVLRANLRAQSAEDRAAFYLEHPNLKPEVRDQVENAFTRLSEAGTPFIRKDILKWVRGEQALKDDQAAAERERAAAAVTAGGHSVPHAQMGERDYHSMGDDELALATKGKVF